MVTPRAHSFLNSQYANMDREAGAEGTQHVQLHPQAAQARDLADGQRVEVFNDRGAFEAVARVSEGVVPDAVIAPYGYWKAHVSGGSTVAGVTSAEQTDIGRGAIYSHVAVDVRPLRA